MSYIAAAYWGPRMEPVEACASHAAVFLATLSQISEYFQGWRPQGRSRAEAMRTTPIGLSMDALTELFIKGRNRRDVGNDVMKELGFRIMVWNGRGNEEEASSLSMHCGLYSTVAGLSNAVVINLPKKFDANSTDQARQLIVALSKAWNPDWAIVALTSKKSQHFGPFLDKALYVCSSVNVPSNLPDTARQETLEEGVLFLA